MLSDEQQAAEEAKVQAAHPEREVKAFVIEAGAKALFCVVTSPTRIEWTKYRADMAKAGSSDDQIEAAIERAALAQIRYPERSEVERFFNAKPGVIPMFAKILSDLVGAGAEAREKK